MNSYITQVIKADNARMRVSKGKFLDYDAEPTLYTLLGFSVICLLIILNVNIFDYIFEGLHKINYIFSIAVNFISSFIQYLRLDEMVKQLNELFIWIKIF